MFARCEDVVTFLPPDHLGSTSLATDAAGQAVARHVVARRRYYPYGEERWRVGEVPTDFGFPGRGLRPTSRARDRSAGRHRHRADVLKARYYYPGLGRFFSADTIVPEVLAS